MGSTTVAGAVPGALAAVLVAGAATAQQFPTFDAELTVEVQNDKVYRATDPAARINNLFSEIEAHLAVHFSPDLSIQSRIKLEQVRQPTGRGAFQEEGAYVEELFANYRLGQLTLFAGKFNPGFGIAWDKAPGIYGTDFAEDYELTERLGAGFTYKFETLTWGDHEFGANLFFLDTTALSQSYITKPAFGAEGTLRASRFRKAQGGAGNTERMNNISLTLDGDGISWLPNLAYHLGYLHQSKGSTEPFDENGYVGAVQYTFKLGKATTLTPLVEYARFSKFQGQDQTAGYLTGAATLSHGPWSASIAGTRRRIGLATESSPNGEDWLGTATIGYAFENGVEASVGWARARDGAELTSTLGVLLAYKMRF
jgi:hypothetical protein